MALYKYIPPERLDILKNLLIRFTQPTALNDPFEMRPLVVGFHNPEIAAKKLADEIERQLPAEIAKHQALMSPVQKILVPALLDRLRPEMIADAVELTRKSFPTLKENLFRSLGNALGILSLSETPTSTLMWAHYAANHTGFLIEFDDRHPWFWEKRADTDEFRHLQKVTYMEKPPSPYLSEWSGRDVFYGKLKEWEYEQEWRIIRPLQEASRRMDGDVCLFAVPPESVRGVITGVMTTTTARAELSALLDSDPKLSHVRILSAQLSPTANLIEINANA